MGKTLSVNSGSSSLKWQLFQMPEETVIAKGIFERIGQEQSTMKVEFAGEKHSNEQKIIDVQQCVLLLLDTLIHYGLINDFREITGVGHRVVAGGELFKASVIVDEKVLGEIKELARLAPLHNLANPAGIEAFMKLLPQALPVAVFDTAFHSTMSEKAFLYPIPKKYYDEYSIRKYGAHGTSHYYVSQLAAEMLNRPIDELKLVSAHIGNGASITAIDGGTSVDTSMGLTPLAGVMMGTRSGDIDPSVIQYLIENVAHLNNAAAVLDELNNKSGILGISGLTSDMRDLNDARASGDKNAQLAYDMFIDRLKKYIAQYIGLLNGIDALIFTAGIGENDEAVRQDIIEGLSWFGMEISPELNIRGANGIISTAQSKVKVLVIPTNEELVIAREVETFRQLWFNQTFSKGIA
ncbi:acetate kinase [Lactococcus fujiensis]|uniref:Acetate kinase n=1 Tax=Lactococcus fujiensis JCM 16395 TaxID=1291764 RepID=A0A2A5RQ05_9LACT|nr:acetate kinase [Lactococcus fujiensis]PCS01525.1 acetate kinase [Lactococcus fujiensis JCM 16395]